MAGTLKRSLKRLRENYFCSLVLSGIAKPVWLVSRYLTSQLHTKVVKNGVTIRLPNGRKMNIGRDAGIGTASLLFWHGIDGYECETSRTLRFFWGQSQTFVDVGANCGLYSIMAALWNSDIQVVAFEPLRAIYESLRKNVALNHLEDRVSCENTALSSQSGTALLHVPRSESKDPEATSTLAKDSWQVRHGSPSIEVTTLRFDDYERLRPMRVDLVKIDVEDFEADVLEGMSATIQRDRPFIVCEILSRNTEHRNERTRRLLNALNYTPYWITSAGYVRVSQFDFERVDYKDFLLSPVATEHEIVTDLNVLVQARALHMNSRANENLEEKQGSPALVMEATRPEVA
jgi:FkbM family methyltransferase